jgi:two-component system response regulator YesN
MWNLMMVEDEPIVRLGLKSMNVWQKHQVNWAAEASNGEEALSYDHWENIHILMTDIRMPRIDGLELAARVRDRNPNIQIIFLSSYDEFEYVKKALQIGAVDYLHKPTMGETDISSILDKAILNLRRLEAVQDFEFWDPREKNYFLLTAIDRYTRPPNWRDIWKQYGLPEMPGLYLLARLSIIEQKIGGNDDPNIKDSLYYSVAHFVEEYLKNYCEGIVFTRGLREINVLMMVRDPDRDAVRLYLNKLLKTVYELLHVEMQYSISGLYSDWERIPDAYLEALADHPVGSGDFSPIIKKVYEIIQHRFHEELSLIGLADELNTSVSYLSRQFSREIGESFVDMLTRKRMTQAKKLLRETNMKVYEISEQVGYKNAHYFSRLFKEVIGITPMEYRCSRKKT